MSLMYFSMLNSNMLLDFLNRPQLLCDSIFLKCNVREFICFIKLPIYFKYGWGTLLYFKHNVGMKI